MTVRLEQLEKGFNGALQAFSPVTLSFHYVHCYHLSSMAPVPATRLPLRKSSSEYAFAQKETTKRGLKRCASSEAISPRAFKRAGRGEPGALSLIQQPQQLQVISVSNPQKRLPHDASLSLFVWGCGDDGSLGLGPDHLEEIPQPQRLGRRGITSIAAGGLYTLFLDRDGEASTSPTLPHPSNST